MSERSDEFGALSSLYTQIVGRVCVDIPEDVLETEDIFRREWPPAEELAEEELAEKRFEQRIDDVERRYKSGELSACEAAEKLELSLREFVELFVLDEVWLYALGVGDGDAREALLDDVTELLSREANGLSARDFVEEYVLDEYFFSVAGEASRGAVRRALDKVPAGLLGDMLRHALSVETPLPEFVAGQILTEAWFHEAGVDDAVSRQLLIDKAVADLSRLPECIFNGLWFTAYPTEDRGISDRFVKRLGEAIAAREIELVTGLLAKWDIKTVLLSPHEKNAARLLGYYSQWIDFDASYLPRVEELLEQFRRLPRKSLGGPLDSAYVDMAEGLVRLHYERYDEASKYFERALEVGDDEGDDDLMPVNRYYMARCLWKMGSYKKALDYARDARKHEDVAKRPRRVAAIKMIEGWLLFLDGKTKDARDTLAEAKQVLEVVEPINHGNILSFYGRLELKEERYGKALKYFRQAVLAYQRGDPRHRNVARTHANIANVYYLKASRLPRDPKWRTKLWKLRMKAFEHLNMAEHIYTFNSPESERRNSRGRGKIHSLRALLYNAAKEPDRARAEAEQAFNLGMAKKDHILMGRAKRILCKTASDPWERFAISFEALLHAEKTDNRTLLARVCLYIGSNLLKMSQFEMGNEYLDKAEAYLTEAERKQPYWSEALRRARACGPDEVDSELELALEGTR